MLNLRQLEIAYPEELWLEVSDKIKKEAWKRSQYHSNATAQYNAYFNDICLNTFFSWLKDWFAEKIDAQQPIKIEIFQNLSLSSIWEFINGTIIEVEKNRLALLTFNTEIDELFVPQEWVDIPNWKADYYLAIQLNLDTPNESWLRLRGYVNHQTLKSKGIYEECDRAYYIDEKYLMKNLTTILQQVQPISAEIEMDSIQKLSSKQVQYLLNKLGTASVSSPRLAIEFKQWMALFIDEPNRNRLYEQRLVFKPKEIKNKSSEKATSWIQNVLNSACQTVEPFLNISSAQPIPGFMHNSSDISGYIGTNIISINLPTINQQVSLNIVLIPAKHEPEVIDVFIEVRSTETQKTLPPNLQLIALDGERVMFLEAKAESHDTSIGFEFCRQFKEPFGVKLTLDDFEYVQMIG